MNNVYSQLESWAAGIGWKLAPVKSGYLLTPPTGKPVVCADLGEVVDQLNAAGAGSS